MLRWGRVQRERSLLHERTRACRPRARGEVFGARGHGGASRIRSTASIRRSMRSSRSWTTSDASHSRMSPTSGWRGAITSPLHGLPMAFKDLQPAVGFPWTRGSLIYKDTMPDADSLLVERLRSAGAIPIGKTNVPEFGMGSHTYNKVYGTTLNPYDLTKSAGGSSGGAAAALATGMLPIADGSTSAVRCATRETSTTSSACARASASCRLRRARFHFSGLSSSVPWPGASPIPRCS